MKLCVDLPFFSYQNSVKLFENLCFEIITGECLYIHGANGSGKTTLLKIIAGLQYCKSARVFFKPQKEQSLNFACEYLQTETNGLFLNLSALDNLLFWSKLNDQKDSEENLYKLAQRWGFKSQYSLSKIPVRKFSTGMKKKIALIKVFLSVAPVLLLDEPLNGLDQESSRIFTEELLKTKEKGKVILISSHQKLDACEYLVDKKLYL